MSLPGHLEEALGETGALGLLPAGAGLVMWQDEKTGVGGSSQLPWDAQAPHEARTIAPTSQMRREKQELPGVGRSERGAPNRK